MYGKKATLIFFFGFYIELLKKLLYNAIGGNLEMSQYERDKLSFDNQVVKSNKMIQRKI